MSATREHRRRHRSDTRRWVAGRPRKRGWRRRPRQRSVPTRAHAARRRRCHWTRRRSWLAAHIRRGRARGDAVPPSADRLAALARGTCTALPPAAGGLPPAACAQHGGGRPVPPRHGNRPVLTAPSRRPHGRRRAARTTASAQRPYGMHPAVRPTANAKISKTITPTGRRGPPSAPPLPATCRTRARSATHAARAAAAARTPNRGAPRQIETATAATGASGGATKPPPPHPLAPPRHRRLRAA